VLPRRDKIVTAISKLLLSFVCLMHPSAQAEFAKVNPEMVASLLEPMLWAELQELYPMIANKHTPDLWNRLPTGLQEACIARGHASSREVVQAVMHDIQTNLDDLMDVKVLVITYFEKNPALLVEMFIQCGYQELAFIRNSGATLGFLFGVVQMVVWFFWHPNEEIILKASTQVTATLLSTVSKQDCNCCPNKQRL